MNNCNYYGIDGGTTHWRIFQLNAADQTQNPQPLSLTICDPARHCLSAALLLDENQQILTCGERAYQEISHYDSSININLLDAFKLCFGNKENVVASDPNRRYTHAEALSYTAKLLAKVIERLQEEKPHCLANNSQFFFTHPVHWGKEENNGAIEGEILQDFAQKVRECFPETLSDRIHFLPEPEAALISLVQTKQLQQLANGYTLIVDIGGGTTDLVAGKFTYQGLQDIRHFGAAYGGNHFDQLIADTIADRFNLDETHKIALDRQLRYYGRKFKENLSQQARVNYNQPVNLTVLLASTAQNILRQALSLTCAEFERIVTEGKKSLQDSLLASLEKMELSPRDIGQIILVGGGARLFIIPNILREIFGDSVPIIYSDPPESTVARGAALWGMRSSLITNIEELQQSIVTLLPNNEVTINDSHSLAIVQKSEVNSTHYLNTMDNNQQIRTEMEKLQAELESALKEMLASVGNKLKPQERAEIQQEFNEINILLERLKTGLIWVALFGKTNAGKSSTANSLIGSEVAGVSIAQNHTTLGTYYEKAPWMLVDVPGTLGTPELEKLAVEEAKKAHGHIFVVTGEPYEPELALFNLVHDALPNTPKIVFVNQWDKMQLMPKKDRELVCFKIREKMGKFVRNPDIDIIYGSARLYDPERDEMVRQDLPQLLDRMYEDPSTLGTLMNVLDPAHRADELNQRINNKIVEVRTKVARKIVNGFSIAAAGSEFIPFNQLIATPAISASMVYAVVHFMGKKVSKVEAAKISWELFRACASVLGAEFAASLGSIALDAIGILTGPFGYLISQAAASGLAYFHYRRSVILGEVAIEYARNNFQWAGDKGSVIRRCKEIASQHYFTIQKKK